MSEHTPDLNAQVATKVMGWELHHVPEHPDPAIRWQWNHPEHPEWRRGLPCLHPLPYSTSIADAWLVVEKMRRRGWYYYAIQDWTDSPSAKDLGTTRACFGCHPKGQRAKVVEGYGDTAPEAICRAALAAVEDEK
jgi:hypothetical protein